MEFTRPVEAVRSLKQESGHDLLIYGSGEPFNTLSREQLIDEYILKFHPVILGRGKSLFEDGNPRTGLGFVDSRATAAGVATLVFRQQPATDES